MKSIACGGWAWSERAGLRKSPLENSSRPRDTRSYTFRLLGGGPVRSGVFALQRSPSARSPDKQIELVITFADQAVIAIENVRVFDEGQARTREPRGVGATDGEVGRVASTTFMLYASGDEALHFRWLVATSANKFFCGVRKQCVEKKRKGKRCHVSRLESS